MCLIFISGCFNKSKITEKNQIAQFTSPSLTNLCQGVFFSSAVLEKTVEETENWKTTLQQNAVLA